MWPRRIVAIAVGLATAVGLVGCAPPTTGEVAAEALDEAGVEVGSTWQLVSGQVGGEDLRLLPDRLITFSRTGTGIEGQSSCNTYAEVGMEEETLDDRVFPGLANTGMGCALPGEESLDNPIMDLEEAFLGALYDTTVVAVGGDELRLLGPDATLVFRRHGAVGTERPEPPATTTGPVASETAPDTAPDTGQDTEPRDDPVATAGSWVLGAGTLDGLDLDVGTGGRVDLTASDGQLGGRAACNDYDATYTLDGDRIDVQAGAVTDMGCRGARMDLEAAYLDALRRVTTVERSDGQLTLSGDGVKLTFAEQEPLAAAELVRTRWELETLLAGGTATSARGEGFLQLEPDGTMTGSTGCRMLAGEWTANGSSLSVPSMEATGDCRPDLADQDGHVVEVLEDMGVAVEGDQLVLESRHGEVDTGRALVYRAMPTPSSDATSAPGTGPDPTADPTRDAGDIDTSSDALFAGTVFLWRTGGIAGLDESVTIRGDGLISVTSEDVGSDHQLDRARLASVAAALDAFDWDDLAARAEMDATADDAITWHVQRFERVLDITDTQLPDPPPSQLPDPPPSLLVEAAELMDEFAPDA